MFRGTIARSLLPLVLLLGVIPHALAAQDTEILRGKITDSTGKPLVGAQVMITGATTQMARSVNSNDKGIYTTFFTSPEGEYIITTRKIGFASKTVRVLRTGASAVLVADFKLQAVTLQLDSIVATGRPMPKAGDVTTNGTDVDLGTGALFSLDPADLLALAASIPGVLSLGDSGFSVLGAGADQNNITIDGSTTGNTFLPRDAIGSATLSLTPFDGSKGRFSGGQMSVKTKGGTDIFASNIRASTTDKRLAWQDPASTSTIPKSFSTSGSIAGPIRKGRAQYFGSFDIQNRANDLYSLLAPRIPLLQQSGLSIDTVTALTGTLGDIGVPLTSNGIPTNNTQDRATVFTRLDFAPSGTFSTKLQFNASRNIRGGSGISQSSYPAAGTGSQDRGTSVQFQATGYLAGFMTEFTSFAEHNTSVSAPYLFIPGGTVRVGTSFGDGRTGLTTLRFGGGSGGQRASSNWSWDTKNEASWMTMDSRHRLKAGQEVRLEGNTLSQTNNRYGTYNYQTLSDLTNGLPSSYSRTLTVHERASNGISGALWLGDDFRYSNNLQFQGSLRFDISKPGTVPDYNPVVDSLFARHTDRVPRDVGFAPRLGFTWTPTAGAGGVAKNASGGPFNNRRPVTFSGGVGAYRGAIAASRIAGMVDQTGLPTTTRTLTCIGAAAPPPDWNASSALPEECLDGTAPTDYSISQPNVTVFDPSYQAPLSWRGSLNMAGLAVKGLNVSVNTTYSLGFYNESAVNLNMSDTPYFTLPGEGDRPVYVPIDGIVTTTGGIAPGAGRMHSEFQRVSNLLADLSSRAAQITVNISPAQRFLGKVPVSFSYNWSHQTAEERGFQSSTGGNPFLKEWAPGRQSVHQFSLNTGFNIWWFQLSTRLNLLSGTPYTPMVVGDINGDGAGNDRAFIPNPATLADTAFSGQLRTLLAATPASARKCLESQFGKIAARNSCRTGWQITTDVGFNFNPPKNFAFGDRLRFTMTMANATGAMLRLAGLADSPLGRSSATGAPNNRLLYVTGFDPETQTYSYRVNQLFGEREDFANKGQRFAPFQITLGAEWRLGGPPSAPMARGLGLLPPDRAPALTRTQVRDKLRKLSSNPVATIMSLEKKIDLDYQQMDRLHAVDSAFVAKTDSLFAPLADYVVAKSRKVSDDDIRKLLGKAQGGMQALLLDTSTKALAQLTPAQQAKLPNLAGAKAAQKQKP